MSSEQADRILGLLDALLLPGTCLHIARDSGTNEVIVRAETTHRGTSIRDALAQYLQTRI